MLISTLKLPDDVSETVRRALAEDVGPGDLTAALIPAEARAEAQVITREDAVLCGTAWFDEVFHQVDKRIRVVWLIKDGDAMRAGQALCNASGPAANWRYQRASAAGKIADCLQAEMNSCTVRITSTQ